MSRAGQLARFTRKFTDLVDVPSLAGKAGKGLRVNAGGTGLETGMQQPLLYRSAFGGEATNDLQITTADFSNWGTIFVLALPALFVDDQISVAAGAQIRNNAAFRVEVVQAVVLSNVAAINAGDPIDGTGVYIVPGTGHNIDNPGNHYYDVPKCAKYKLLGNYATPYLHYRVRARGPSVGTDYVTVLNGYGHLDVQIFPKAG